MPITLKSTGGGSVSIDVPSTGATFTLTAPANNATIFTTDGGAITGNVAFTSNNISIGGQTISPAVGMRNRIINGDMRVDQRNAGASVTQTATDTYTLDRWDIAGSVSSKFTVQQNAGSVTPPAGFKYYLGITSSSSYSVGTNDFFYLMQGIEGYNVADLGFGAAGASAVTISFWVRSSLTGNFGGCLRNKIAGADRSYPFTYVINSANTWEQKTITISGDTTGTWASTTACSITVCFGLGTGSTYSGTSGAWAASNIIQPTSTVSVVGTNGATFYITGVQLEVGSVATPFEYRSFGTELALCQRYFEKSYDTFSPVPTNTTVGNHVGTVDTQSLTAIAANIRFRVEKRTNPTMNFYKYETTAGVWARNSDNASTGTITTPWGMGSTGVGRLDSSTSLTSGAMYHGQWSATAEF